MEETRMRTQSTEAPTALEPQPAFSSTKAAMGANASVPDSETEPIDIDELLAYNPVPFRRVITVAVRYRQVGKLEPLPFPLTDEEAEA
jgi:hypothetical protein